MRFNNAIQNSTTDLEQECERMVGERKEWEVNMRCPTLIAAELETGASMLKGSWGVNLLLFPTHTSINYEEGLVKFLIS